MQHEIRRKDRKWHDQEEMLRFLDEAEFGVLSLIDAHARPYAVPLNFVRDGRRLLFHCAPEGRKLDCIRFSPRVSFCVVGKTQVQPEIFSTLYESVIIEGSATLIEDEAAKIRALRILCRKYSPEHLLAAERAIEKSLHRTGVFEVTIDSMTGKAKRK